MNRRLMMRAGLSAALCAAPMFADFTYTETSQLTGGAMMSMMKMAGVFAPKGQKPTDPIQTTVALQGNRMVRKSNQVTTIIDLDKQTITTIHHPKKTYSVTTFAQMKQQLQQMQQQMASNKDAQNMSLDVKVNDTGATKPLDGLTTHEQIVTMVISGTDPQTGKTGAMNMRMDMWLSTDVPGYQEVIDFNRRMADELGWTPGASAMLPNGGKAFAELFKQTLHGLPLQNVIDMMAPGDGTGAQTQATPEQQQQRQAAQDQAQAAQQEAQTHAQEQASSNPTAASAIAGALGSRFGGFGRHKKQQQQQDDSNNSSNNAQAAPVSSQNAATGLIQMTTTVTNFQQGGADSSWFDVPTGYTQVEENIAEPPSGGKHR